MTRGIAGARRVYAVLLRLYPPSFYREFGDSMIEDFSEASRDVARDLGTRALIVQWLAAVADLSGSIPRQWLRLPAAWIVPGAAAGAAVYLQTAAVLAANAPLLNLRAQAGREEEMLLALVLLTALFPVVAVIVFAWWFLAPMLMRETPRRPRA